MPDAPLTPPSNLTLSGATLEQLISELGKRAQCHGTTSPEGADVISQFGENSIETKSHRNKIKLTDEERTKAGALVVVMVAPVGSNGQRQCVCTMLGEGDMIRGAIEVAADHYMNALISEGGPQ
jgi:hypothetical protein